jgi:hypothetical protein
MTYSLYGRLLPSPAHQRDQRKDSKHIAATYGA